RHAGAGRGAFARGGRQHAAPAPRAVPRTAPRRGCGRGVAGRMSAVPEPLGPPPVLSLVPAPGAAARREHAFRSLLELGRELTVSADLYGTADLLMFNLMGQLGVARAAL